MTTTPTIRFPVIPMLRLEYERRSRRLTQQDLGRLVGCSGPAVATIERGSFVPSEDLLDKLAAALGYMSGAMLLRPVALAADPEERAALIEATERLETGR